MTEIKDLPALVFDPSSQSYQSVTAAVVTAEPVSLHPVKLTVIEEVQDSPDNNHSDYKTAGKLMAAINEVSGYFKAAGLSPREVVRKGLEFRNYHPQQGEGRAGFNNFPENLVGGHVESDDYQALFEVVQAGEKPKLLSGLPESALVPVSTGLTIPDEQSVEAEKIEGLVIRPTRSILLEDKKAA